MLSNSRRITNNRTRTTRLSVKSLRILGTQPQLVKRLGLDELLWRQRGHQHLLLRNRRGRTGPVRDLSSSLSSRHSGSRDSYQWQIEQTETPQHRYLQDLNHSHSLILLLFILIANKRQCHCLFKYLQILRQLPLTIRWQLIHKAPWPHWTLP